MKKKIVFISPSFFPTFAGTEVEIFNIATQLSSKYEITLLLPSYCEEFNRNKKYDFKLDYFNSFWLKVFSKYPNKLIPKIFNFQFGEKLRLRYENHIKFIFFIHPTLTFFSKVFANIEYAVPQGVDVQSDLKSNYGFTNNPIIKNLMQESIEKIRPEILYMSESMKESILQLFNYAVPIHYVPTGTHVEFISNYTINRDELFKEYGILPDEKILLTAARFNKKKGFHHVEEVCSKLIEKKLKFRWILIGRDVRLLEKFLSNEVRKRIIFLEPFGFDSNNLIFPPLKLIELYKLADVFCNLSKVEGFSLINLDILSSGTPIVAFNSPGLKDILNDKNAYVIPEEDINNFTENIIKAITEKNLKANAALKSVANYSWKNIVLKYQDLIQKPYSPNHA